MSVFVWEREWYISLLSSTLHLYVILVPYTLSDTCSDWWLSWCHLLMQSKRHAWESLSLSVEDALRLIGLLDTLSFWGTSMCCSPHSTFSWFPLSSPPCLLSFSNYSFLISDAGRHGLWASVGLFCQSGHLWILFRSKSGSGCVERVSIMNRTPVRVCFLCTNNQTELWLNHRMLWCSKRRYRERQRTRERNGFVVALDTY